MRKFRWLLDILIGIFSIYTIYYILLFVFNLVPIYYFFLNLLHGINGNSLHLLIKYIIISTIIIGIHTLLSIWMFADVSKRAFSSNTQQVYWITMILVSLSPLYYFVHGRKPLK